MHIRPDRDALFSFGFSLVELLIVCAILGVLAVAASPSFRDIALNARRTEQVNALLHGLYAARNAAILRATPVVLCKSRDGQQCDPSLPAWSDGWIMFANKDADSPPAVDAGEQVLLHQQPAGQLKVQGNRDALTYWPVSLAATTASFVFCDERGTAAARSIVVSATGRPRVSDKDSSGQALSCD